VGAPSCSGAVYDALRLESAGSTMDLVTYTIRPFVESDYDGVARINALIDPEHPETAEESRRWADVITGTPGRLMHKLVAEEARSGQTVGWGGLTHVLWSYHPDKYYIRAAVDPAHRGRGIGQELYTRLEKEAFDRNAVCLWSGAREDDDAGVRFLDRHGFLTLRKIWLSRLDLTGLDLSSFPDRSRDLQDRGIRITTVAAEGFHRSEVQRRVYDLVRVTAEDVPRVGEYTPATFEEFVALELQEPKILPDAFFLACQGEEYVGLTSLQREPGLSDTLGISFTGTLPNFRGQGIASELKRQAVEYARTQGTYRYIITGNDSLNPRIWAINEKLGFRREQTWLSAEKSLPRSQP
jgi:RimJ/RimL family protein N-acetyltransferase